MQRQWFRQQGKEGAIAEGMSSRPSKNSALYEILQTFTLWARIELLIAQALGYLEGLS